MLGREDGEFGKLETSLAYAFCSWQCKGLSKVADKGNCDKQASESPGGHLVG